MNAIKGVVKNGRVEVAVPPDWQEGSEVLIEPVRAGATQGMREEDWPTTPDGIAALLARMDALEPLEQTAEEEAAWKAARAAQKQVEKDSFEEDAERLRRMWE